MTILTKPVTFEATGHDLAEWWWQLDSKEQAEFFTHIALLRSNHPVSFHSQLLFVQDALIEAFGALSQ